MSTQLATLPTFDKTTREECKLCPRFTGTYVPPRLVDNPKLIIVDEAPLSKGVLGERTLRSLLSKQGIELEECSIVHVVGCTGSEEVGVEEVEACAGVLGSVLDSAYIREPDGRSRQVPVLTLGDLPLRRLVGLNSSHKWRGSILHTPAQVTVGTRTVLGPEVYKSGEKKGSPKPRKEDVVVEQKQGRTVVCTISPDDLRAGGFEDLPLVSGDLRRALSLSLSTPPDEVGLLNQPYAGPEQILDVLNSHSRIVLDVETDRRTGKWELLGIAADADRAVCAVPGPELWEPLSRWLTNGKNLLVGHNIGFDIKVLQRNLGITVGAKVWDTMHGAHFERQDLPKALDMVASRLPGVRYHNWKAAFHEGLIDGRAYNALDVAWTAKIWEHQQKEFERRNVTKHFTDDLMPLVPILTEMETRGVRIDTEALEQLRSEQTKVVEQLVDRWNTLTGDLNPNSPKQLQDFFYGQLGLKKKKDRKTGRVTLNKEAVAKLIEENPDVEPLQILGHIRHAEKVISTYLTLELDGDHRLHPQYNLSGTDTGRLSSGGDEGFNFQNIPRGRGECPRHVPGCVCGRLRELFLSECGRCAVGDWSQIEARITAILAGQRDLVAAFATPGFDIHSHTAALMGLTGDGARDKAKAVAHGKNYLMGDKTLAHHMKTSIAEARKFSEAWNQAYPQIVSARMMWFAQAQKYGFIENPFGRRYYIKGRAEAPKIAAFMGSSPAAAMMQRAIRYAHEAGLILLWTVHDELGIEAESEREVKLLREVMEMAVPELGGWSCPVDIGTGRSWKEAKGH